VRNRDDETQVCIDHPLARSGIAFFDPGGELDLLLPGQERNSPDFSKVDAQTVIALVHADKYSQEPIRGYDARVGF
jgi:hypothetical protein